MGTYRVNYIEKLLHTWEIEAESKTDAIDAFQHMMDNSEFDFSYGEVIDTEVEFERIGE